MLDRSNGKKKVMTTWKASVISTYFRYSELSVCVP